MAEVRTQNRQEDYRYRKRRMLGPVERTALAAALLLVMICLAGFYIEHNQHSFVTQTSALKEKWRYAQANNIAEDKLPSLQKHLSRLKSKHLGPIPASWFLHLDGVQHQLNQFQAQTKKIESDVMTQKKKQAKSALSHLKETEGTYFSQKKQYQAAFQKANTPEDYAGLAKKWTVERKKWLATQSKLKKMSGGWIDHHPADVVQKKEKLADLLKTLLSHTADAKKAGNLLNQAKQYVQMAPSKQLQQHDTITSKLQSMIAKLKQDEAPKILDVPLVNQMAKPELYNGCEVTSLAMILQYSGYKVTKTELAHQIPKVPITYKNGLKGNPNIGFVGDIDGSSPGYFVYHGPIAALAKKYAGNRVQDLTGENISKVYQKIDEGIPVWVITTTVFAPVDDIKTWKTPHGKVKVSPDEHSAVVTGYSSKYVWLNNPYGHKNEKVNRHKFEQSWIEMGRQAVVINVSNKH